MGTVIALPRRRTPRQVAKAYMEGTLRPDELATVSGGIARLVLLAEEDDPKAAMAKIKALEHLARLAGIEREDIGTGQHDVAILPIRAIDGGEIVLDKQTG